MVPPWRATMPWTMESPSPTPRPPSLVLKKGSKIRARTSGGMPLPSSATRATTSLAAGAESESVTVPPSGGRACAALVTRFTKTWSRPARPPRIVGAGSISRRTRALASRSAGSHMRATWSSSEPRSSGSGLSARGAA